MAYFSNKKLDICDRCKEKNKHLCGKVHWPARWDTIERRNLLLMKLKDIVKSRELEFTYKEIGKRYGCSHNMIYQMLKNNDFVTGRKKSRTATNKLDETDLRISSVPINDEDDLL